MKNPIALLFLIVSTTFGIVLTDLCSAGKEYKEPTISVANFQSNNSLFH